MSIKCESKHVSCFARCHWMKVVYVVELASSPNDIFLKAMNFELWSQEVQSGQIYFLKRHEHLYDGQLKINIASTTVSNNVPHLPIQAIGIERHAERDVFPKFWHLL